MFEYLIRIMPILFAGIFVYQRSKETKEKLLKESKEIEHLISESKANSIF